MVVYHIDEIYQVEVERLGPMCPPGVVQTKDFVVCRLNSNVEGVL